MGTSSVAVAAGEQLDAACRSVFAAEDRYKAAQSAYLNAIASGMDPVRRLPLAREVDAARAALTASERIKADAQRAYSLSLLAARRGSDVRGEVALEGTVTGRHDAAARLVAGQVSDAEAARLRALGVDPRFAGVTSAEEAERVAQLGADGRPADPLKAYGKAKLAEARRELAESCEAREREQAALAAARAERLRDPAAFAEHCRRLGVDPRYADCNTAADAARVRAARK